MKKSEAENVEYALRGDEELLRGFKIGEKLAQKMREAGMPHYSIGGSSNGGYLYFPDEVKQWIKANYRVVIPEIKLQESNKAMRRP